MLYAVAVLSLLTLGVVLWLVLAMVRLDERSRAAESLPQKIDANKDETLRQVRAELQSTKTDFQNKTDSAVASIQAVTGQLGERLKAAGATLDSLQNSTGQLIAGLQTVSELRDVFLVPQRRGPQSEVHLQSLLENIFPHEDLKFPYSPDPGASEKVEAAVRIAERWLPIDSKAHIDKFLEAKKTGGRKEKTAFLNAIKGSVEDISAKYIRPERGTHDFAFLFVPAESLWLEITEFKTGEDAGPDLFSYARAKKVILVSPQTLYPYLRLVMVAMAGKQLQDKAQELHLSLQGLLTRFHEVRECVDKASKQLGTAKTNLDEARAGLEDFESSLKRGVSLAAPRGAGLIEPPVGG
ncbi:MAG: DNA recombination protein RmuC [Elusimicrobia bacterium]|nr:DNA recombination protein RmuC [Elusimicrobiota bacterium]